MQAVAEILSNQELLRTAVNTVRESTLCGGMLARMANQFDYLVDKDGGPPSIPIPA